MNRLIITADLGRIKVFRVTQFDLIKDQTKPAIALETDIKLANTYSRFGQRDTDQAGRFSSGSAAGSTTGMSSGERHEEQKEAEKSQLQKVAEKINATLKEYSTDEFYLAVPQTIHKQLLELLDPTVEKRMLSHLAVDLTGAKKKELLQRFNLD